VREHGLGHLPHIALALAFTAAMAFVGLVGFAFSDYDVEASAAFWALRTGDLDGFLAAVPAYGGSFVLRAPFAWAPALWGGGELAVFRAVSLPGLAACAGPAVFVAGRMREAGRSRLDRVVVLGALTASPAALSALEYGHPEELLGGALCVAVVLAARTRPIVAGAPVGLAVANKPWALVRAGRPGRRAGAQRAPQRAGVRSGRRGGARAAWSCSAGASLRSRSWPGTPAPSSSRGRRGSCSASRASCTSRWASACGSCGMPPSGSRGSRAR
jgi:hypothetical protein